MAETGNWNGHVFIVSPTLIRGFTGLTIKGASETDTKTSSKQQYLERKAGKPVEAAITVELNAVTGCDVRSEALAFVAEARDGKKNYFYVGNKKLLPCQLMLTEASVEETRIAPNGTWISARVKLTMKQASKNDGTSSSSSSKKTTKKASVKKSTSTTKKTSIITTVVNTVKNVVNTVKNVISNITKSSAFQKAQAAVKKVVSTAKAASKAKPVVKPAVKKNALLK